VRVGSARRHAAKDRPWNAASAFAAHGACVQLTPAELLPCTRAISPTSSPLRICTMQSPSSGTIRTRQPSTLTRFVSSAWSCCAMRPKSTLFSQETFAESNFLRWCPIVFAQATGPLRGPRRREMCGPSWSAPRAAREASYAVRFGILPPQSNRLASAKQDGSHPLHTAK
jgi:hypothetical protein